MDVRQEHVSAGRDVIVADRVIHNSASTRASPIATLMERLAEEIRNDQKAQSLIDTLQYYQERHSVDGVDGLENKLSHSGRSAEIPLAIRQKELFSRLLARHSMFESAQHIFAYLLAKIEQDFKCYVSPNIESSTKAEIDIIINERLVAPCVEEVGAGVFSLNHNIAMGMVYWLAEQCFVRWHN